jgi:hypothetical protein
MNRSEHEGTFQLITAIVIASVLALLLWNLAIRDVGATTLDRTCYEYPVMLRHVSCTRIGWCSAFETLHVNGLSTVTVRVTGWKLRNGQIRPVSVCR